MTRVFITGGTGFIGKPLCEALAGHDLLVVAPQPPQDEGTCRYLAGSVFEIDAWKRAVRDFAPEVCVHLAWAGLPDYSLPTSTKNFQAGLELCQFLREIGCPRVVVAGTCWEYGTLTGCVREDQDSESLGLFAACKAAQRLVAASLLAGSATTLLWARPFFVYGPGQRPTSLIPACYHALCAGQPLEIKSPDVVNDFIHVDDVAQGLAALATSSAPGGSYNLGSGTPTRVRDVANLIARLLGRPPVFEPCASRGNGFWADLTRIETATGWRPRIALEDGIRRTLDAWRAAT